MLISKFYWPTLFQDAHEFYKGYGPCQRVGNLSRRNEIFLTPIIIYKIFDVWDMDFRGPFPSSFRYMYILLPVDYVSKWVEAKSTRIDDFKVVVDFLKSNIFTRFGVPKAIISDQESHFCNRIIEVLVKKYEIFHKTSISYHPQANG